MSRALVISISLVSLMLAGCANLDYIQNLKSDDLLYKPFPSPLGMEKNPVPDWRTVGSDRYGFVGIDTSDESKRLDEAFPVQVPTASDLEPLNTHSHRMRLGQVLVFSADIDPRTSGFLKDEKNQPLSVSGRFEPNANTAIAQGVSSGAAAGAASGVMAVNSINNQVASAGLKLSSTGSNAVIGGQMAQGLIAGLVAGVIHAGMAESALNGIVSGKDFGERMEATTLTAAHLLPNLAALGPDGLVRSSAPVVVAPGLVKRYFLRFGQKALNYRNEYYLISAVGVFRGKEYEKKYPNTLGWSYSISNMASIHLNPDEASSPEKAFRAIKRETSGKNMF